MTITIGSIVVSASTSLDVDSFRPIDPFDNISIKLAHSPHQRIVIERADRWDLLIALMEAQGVDPDVVRIVIPQVVRPPMEGHAVVMFESGEFRRIRWVVDRERARGFCAGYGVSAAALASSDTRAFMLPDELLHMRESMPPDQVSLALAAFHDPTSKKD